MNVLFKPDQDVFAEVEISEDHLTQGKKILIQKYHTSVSRTKPKHVIEVGLTATTTATTTTTTTTKYRKKRDVNRDSDDEDTSVEKSGDWSDCYC